MDRLFLDANVLFSAAYREHSRLLDFWAMTDVELVTSDYAVEEARRNLATDSQRLKLANLASKSEVVSATEFLALPSTVTLPEKDVPILAAAIAASSTHLITGDKTHFGEYFGQRIVGVLIQAPSDYLADRAKKV